MNKITQPGLSRALSRGKDEVSTKTINNIVNARNPPQLDNLSTIADYFDVPLWVMFIPELPKELLEKEKLARLQKLVEDYLLCANDERRFAENIAAGYAGLRTQK